jgi:hypothetical protein
MFLNLHPKCANPSCAASFEWLAGGRLFRFRRDSRPSGKARSTPANPGEPQPVWHFWLCEKCSHIYTVRNVPERGPMVLPLWPELRPGINDMRLPFP